MDYNMENTYGWNMKNMLENSKIKFSYVEYVKDSFEERSYDEHTRNIIETPNLSKLENLREKKRECLYKTLLDITKEDEECDLYIVNTDHELTETIVNTFKTHNCKVTVSQLERDLMALYVLLDRKIKIKKLRKLVERGKKFGLEFFLTKTGMTTSLMDKVKNIFKR